MGAADFDAAQSGVITLVVGYRQEPWDDGSLPSVDDWSWTRSGLGHKERTGEQKRKAENLL